jgi:hypothetical protein
MRRERKEKGHVMWALVIFTFATSGAASGTVTTLEFNTQQLCLIASRELAALTEPITAEGPARYKVAGTCVQTTEVTKK